jgi:hypothetical protein
LLCAAAKWARRSVGEKLAKIAILTPCEMLGFYLPETDRKVKNGSIRLSLVQIGTTAC